MYIQQKFIGKITQELEILNNQICLVVGINLNILKNSYSYIIRKLKVPLENQ